MLERFTQWIARTPVLRYGQTLSLAFALSSPVVLYANYIQKRLRAWDAYQAQNALSQKPTWVDSSTSPAQIDSGSALRPPPPPLSRATPTQVPERR